MINKPIEVTGVEVEYPISISDTGKISYKKAEKVYLVSNPSTKNAYKNKHDLALLKIDTEIKDFLSLNVENPKVGDASNVIGFTMRTARLEENKKKYNYEDANYDLRVSTGSVQEIDSDSTFLTNADGGPGNSGSATLDDKGNVIGVYFGATANGLVDPTNVRRRHILIKSVRDFFKL